MSEMPAVQPRASSAEFFEEAYRRSADPWNFAGSAYEQSRYRETMAALDGQRFQRAFEPGCSIGVLTEKLAAVCDRVDALDFSPTAVAQARARCAHLPGVHVACAGLLPLPDMTAYDLVVLSEIGYYFAADDWRRIAAELVAGLKPGATLLGVHWRGHSEDHQISGDAVHEILDAHAGLEATYAVAHESFRLVRWIRQ